MDKRYQVFVSSTFEDLQEERKEVMQALLELDCIPSGMELFPASSEDQWSLIKRVIDDCDYYLLIIGGRYGSVNDQGISYTQMEFEYALEKNKPMISFLHKAPDNLPVHRSEQDPEKRKKLEEFRALAKRKIIKMWDSPENLGSAVSRSMIHLIKNFPTEGWVKARYATDEELLRQVAQLQKENNQLQSRLISAEVTPPINSNIYAQDDDVFEFEVSIECETIGILLTETYKSTISLTWNEIYISMAPRLIEKCSERRMKNALLEYIVQNHHKFFSFSDEVVGVKTAKISHQDFARIKVQLRALGYINICKHEPEEKDHETYWKLTPYGDMKLTQILAIHR